MSESISSVTSQRGCAPSTVSSLSSVKPEYAQMSFSGNRARTRRRNGTSARWFSGSNGSPPSSVRPRIKGFSSSEKITCSAAASKGLP